jgi:serine/threonine-protein kinase
MSPYPGYTLRHFLGRGAFGQVWQAEAPLGWDVALKFLPCDKGPAHSIEMRSLQVVRQLPHRHLVRIHRVWFNWGYIIIAMELAEGSLLDLLQLHQAEFGRSLSAKDVCRYLIQAADALDFLNQRRHHLDGRLTAIQHRDIKPSNMLLFGDLLKLADFGLAAPLCSRMERQRKAGTLDYLAPEVFQGCVSDQTDQYALAVSYCYLRGGRFPFPDTPETFQAGYARPAPDLSMLSPPEQPIIARALEPAPHARWSSCGELLERLTRLANQEEADHKPSP